MKANVFWALLGSVGPILLIFILPAIGIDNRAVIGAIVFATLAWSFLMRRRNRNNPEE